MRRLETTAPLLCWASAGYRGRKRVAAYSSGDGGRPPIVVSIRPPAIAARARTADSLTWPAAS